MLQVEFTGQLGRVANRSGQNVFDAEELTLSVSRKRGEIA